MVSRLSLATLLGTICAASAAPEARCGDAQLHLRGGLVSASYSSSDGSIQGKQSIPGALDAEYEFFLGARNSFVIRGLFGFDISSARLLYAYTGLGKRFYFGSRGLASDEKSGGTRVVIVPKWRFYLGGDAGIAQVVVKTFGSVLQANSALFDIGPNAGAIYQASRSLGIEMHLGYAWGFGFSNVSVGASTLRTFLGATYFL